MYPSPPMTQQPPQSQPVTSPRLNVPDNHLQSSDNRSHAHAVKLALHQVNFFYGDHQALFNIDIEIMKNQVTSFIGPSGCGKSTLLNLIGVILPGLRSNTMAGGTIHLRDGVPLEAEPEPALAALG